MFVVFIERVNKWKVMRSIGSYSDKKFMGSKKFLLSLDRHVQVEHHSTIFHWELYASVIE